MGKLIDHAPDGTVTEHEFPDPVPDAVTNADARRALIRAGLFDQANAAAGAAGGEAYQMWEYANHFYRADPILIALGHGIGLTDQQLDALFIAAAQITA